MSEPEGRLEAIRQRVSKATEGPWYRHGGHFPHEPFASVSNWRSPHTEALTRTIGRDIYPANAEFIAHAREDIPWLLDQLAAQEAEIARLTSELEAEREKHDEEAYNDMKAAKEAAEGRLTP